jgi:hypothetical protein
MIHAFTPGRFASQPVIRAAFCFIHPTCRFKAILVEATAYTLCKRHTMIAVRWHRGGIEYGGNDDET